MTPEETDDKGFTLADWLAEMSEEADQEMNGAASLVKEGAHTMDVREDVVKAILQRVAEMPLDEESGALRLSEEDVADLDDDTIWGEYLEEGEEVLGHYEPMSSPGRIVLRVDKLVAFFWHIIRQMVRAGFTFWRDDLDKLAWLSVTKTYQHEHFHLFCDIQSHLVPTLSKDRHKEEALAVAFSRLCIERERGRWQSRIGRTAHVQYSRFMATLFQYRSPGYCDWKNFASAELFREGLVDYVDPPDAKRLEANGVPVGEFLWAQLEKVGMCAKEEVLV